MNHHRLPDAMPHPVNAPAGNEIRFPAFSGNHNLRAHKEEANHAEKNEA